jgi:hypothetical protein
MARASGAIFMKFGRAPAMRWMVFIGKKLGNGGTREECVYSLN